MDYTTSLTLKEKGDRGIVRQSDFQYKFVIKNALESLIHFSDCLFHSVCPCLRTFSRQVLNKVYNYYFFVIDYN